MQQSEKKVMQITRADYAAKKRNGILKAKNDRRAMHILPTQKKKKEFYGFDDHYFD